MAHPKLSLWHLQVDCTVPLPAFTGGPFTYIDNYGVAEFVRDADELSARYGERFEPPKLLRDMAAEGRCFYS